MKPYDPDAPLRCEGHHSSRPLAPLAKYVASDRWTKDALAVCGQHARVYGSRAGTPPTPLTPELEATIRARLAEVARVLAEEAVEREREHRIRTAERYASQLASLQDAWQMTLVLGAAFFGRDGEVAVVVHKGDLRREPFDAIYVAITSEGPGSPSFLVLRASSPTRLTPNAATLLVEALGIVTAWVIEANAIETPMA